MVYQEIDRHIQGLEIFKPHTINPNIQKEIPDINGLYMLGKTTYDFYNNKVIYMLKVGMSNTSLKKRINSYKTTAPEAFVIWASHNYLHGTLKQIEKDWHNLFKKMNFYQVEGTEWYIVSEEYFKKILNKYKVYN